MRTKEHSGLYKVFKSHVSLNAIRVICSCDRLSEMKIRIHYTWLNINSILNDQLQLILTWLDTHLNYRYAIILVDDFTVMHPL